MKPSCISRVTVCDGGSVLRLATVDILCKHCHHFSHLDVLDRWLHTAGTLSASVLA